MAQLDDVETLRRLLQMRESELREARRLLERASIYDDATGMLNRAGLTLVVQDRLNWLRRKSEPFAIAKITVGDTEPETIKRLASRIRATLRAVDSVGRVDEDTFVAVLAECDRTGVSAVLQRLSAIAEDAGTLPRYAVTVLAAPTRTGAERVLDAALQLEARAGRPLIMQGY